MLSLSAKPNRYRIGFLVIAAIAVCGVLRLHGQSASPNHATPESHKANSSQATSPNPSARHPGTSDVPPSKTAPQEAAGAGNAISPAGKQDEGHKGTEANPPDAADKQKKQDTPSNNSTDLELPCGGCKDSPRWLAPLCSFFCEMDAVGWLIIAIVVLAAMGGAFYWFKSRPEKPTRNHRRDDYSSREYRTSSDEREYRAPVDQRENRSEDSPEESRNSAPVPPRGERLEPTRPAYRPATKTEEDAVQALAGKVEELASCVRLLQQSIGDPNQIDQFLAAAEVPRIVNPTAAAYTAEEILLSAADYFLSGNCTKADLPNLLAQINVRCVLMRHTNIEAFLTDPGATRAEFVRSEQDGCWLWHEASASKCLALPIDARIFRIPPAPSFLARLCDGVGQNSDLNFVRVVRSCVLRPEGNGAFTLMERGSIQTTPGIPVGAPVSSFPVLLDALRPRKQEGTGLAAGIMTLVERIRSSETLDRDFQGRIQALEQNTDFLFQTIDKVEAAVKADRTQSSRDVRDERIAILEQRLKEIANRIPSSSEGFRTSTPSHPASPVVQTTDTIKRLDEARPYRPESKPEPGQYQPSVPSQALAGTPLGPASTGTRPPDRSPSSALPKGWQQVLQQVQTRATRDPAIYLAALGDLFDTLQRLPGASVQLVHVVAPGGRSIEIHDADMIDGSIRCRSCPNAKPCAFAICAGYPRSEALWLLLPLGSYADSNYPTGYASLLSGQHGEAFEISSITSPALLKRIGSAGSAEYAVEQRMQFS